MESTAYFHRIYSIVPWNPLNFHGINGKNLWHFMNFHNFLLLVYLPSTAMETLKTPSEYSVDFNLRISRVFHGKSRDGCYVKVTSYMIVRKTAMIRNQYNQVPYLSQDTKVESNKITINITNNFKNQSQEVSPFMSCCISAYSGTSGSLFYNMKCGI